MRRFFKFQSILHLFFLPFKHLNKWFLNIYKNLLSKGAEIHQKTDNMHFFEFSISEFSQSGFGIYNVSLDLHNSDFPDNIVTEYESRFIALNQPIYRLEAKLND